MFPSNAPPTTAVRAHSSHTHTRSCSLTPAYTANAHDKLRSHPCSRPSKVDKAEPPEQNRSSRPHRRHCGLGRAPAALVPAARPATSARALARRRSEESLLLGYAIVQGKGQPIVLGPDVPKLDMQVGAEGTEGRRGRWREGESKAESERKRERRGRWRQRERDRDKAEAEHESDEGEEGRVCVCEGEKEGQ